MTISPLKMTAGEKFFRKADKMKILLTNDDGINGEGLWAMAKALSRRKIFELVIAAPMNEQSGMAHALTVGKKIEYRKVEHENFSAWAIGGTPTDCVKMYLESMNEGAKVDAVISGINNGANLATDVLYSGTVGAALEGFLHEIPVLAVSLGKDSEINFENVAEDTAEYFSSLIEHEDLFFHNLNFPKKYHGGFAKFKLTRLGRRDYINAFIHTQEGNKNFCEIKGEVIDSDKGEGTDIFAVEQGFVSVTPLHFDITHHKKLN